jgi:hypothetical protein
VSYSLLNQSTMRALRYLFPLLLIFIGCNNGLNAQEPITWETPRIEKTLPIGEPTIAARFAFTNNTDAPISIREITTTCGCTAANHSREAVAPGGSGVVRMEFNAGQRRGLQRNSATVHFEPATIPPQRIEFVVVIPDVISARPALLRWPQGTLSQTRTLTIALNPEFGTQLVEIDYPQQHFKLTLTHGPAQLAEDVEWEGIEVVSVEDQSQSLQLEILPNPDQPPSADRYTFVLYAITTQGTRHEQRLHLRMQ